MSATACRYSARVLGRRRGAEMRLQRHVAEILQRDDAERVRVAEDGGHRQRHLLQQARDVRERQRGEIDRVRRAAPAPSTAPSGEMMRKYRRSEASPVSGTTRTAGRAASPLAPARYSVDAVPARHRTCAVRTVVAVRPSSS